jgi:guanine deaminase
VARRRRLRMVAGKAMMDRHCPEFLRDTAQTSYDESKRLIDAWHGRDRLGYAITPRFAITSSEAQMEAAGVLAREHPELTVHSHVAENPAEVAWVRELYPWSRSYLDVYDRYGLLRPGAVYAHCIYLDEHDRRRMAESGAAAAFSPTSNLFLGSGLFDLRQALDAGVRVGVATDIGGGTSFSMLRTLAAAYQVSHLKGHVLSPLRAFYLATLSGAQALRLDDAIGNFLPGKEADFIVLDPAATPLLARRMATARTLEERLFLWLTLGDDRSVQATYVMGEAQWQRPR